MTTAAWVIVSEVWPLGLRAKGVSIGASSNWLNNFAVAMSTPDFVDAAPYGACKRCSMSSYYFAPAPPLTQCILCIDIFLGAMCVCAVGYVLFFVPETKNKTLDELDAVFGDTSNRSTWEAELLAQAQRDVGLLSVAQIEVAGDDKASGKGSFPGEKEKPLHGHIEHRELAA